MAQCVFCVCDNISLRFTICLIACDVVCVYFSLATALRQAQTNLAGNPQQIILQQQEQQQQQLLLQQQQALMEQHNHHNL